MKLSRNTLNFILDGTALLAFSLLVTTGLIMEFRLPPGQGRRGGGESQMLGLGRHDWGEVHFIIAIVFMVLVAVHLYMHWEWIWAMAKGKRDAKARTRAFAFLGATAVLLILPVVAWLVPVVQGAGH